MKVGRMPVASNWPRAPARFVDAFLHVAVNVLHDDRVLFHADDFRDMRHAARTALQPAGLDDQLHGAGRSAAAWL